MKKRHLRWGINGSFPAGFSVLWIVFLGMWCGASPLRADVGRPTSEYQVKAVFLFNFTKFVDWPADAFSSNDDPLIIGVVGENPFGDALDEAIKNERVKGRKLKVKQFASTGPLTGCHILFISRSESEHIPVLLEKLGKSPVLTVADTDGFTAKGGMINFVLEDGKIRFDIEPADAERAGLKISSRLLNLPRPANRRKEPK